MPGFGQAGQNWVGMHTSSGDCLGPLDAISAYEATMERQQLAFLYVFNMLYSGPEAMDSEAQLSCD